MKNVIVKMQGGLGNQMFCYSAAYAVTKDNGLNLIIDKSSYLNNKDHCGRKYELDNYNISIKKDNVIEYKGYLVNKINEFIYKFKYDIRNELKDTLIVSNKDLYLKGFNQNYLLFDKFKDELRNEFSLKNPSNELLNVLELFKDNFTASIHFRFGDYVDIACTIDEKYYHDALKLLMLKFPSERIKLLVFTEDLKRTKEILNIYNDSFEIIYIDDKFKLNDLEQFELMKNCNVNIISNSTFSYFSAYLNNRCSLVIAPVVSGWLKEYWKDDYFPKEWLKINTVIKNEK